MTILGYEGKARTRTGSFDGKAEGQVNPLTGLRMHGSERRDRVHYTICLLIYFKDIYM